MTTPEPVRMEFDWEASRDKAAQDCDAIKRHLDRQNGRESISSQRGRQIGRRPGIIKFWGPGGAPIYAELIHLVAYLAGAGAGAAFLKGIKEIIVAWIRANAHRKITVTVGKTKLEISGINDIDKVIAALEKIPGALPNDEAKPTMVKPSRRPVTTSKKSE